MIYLKLTSNVQVRMIDVKSRVTKLVIEKTREIILEQLPNRLENDLNELICEFVEDGVDSYYNEQLNQTLENISKKHQIPLELLLRDIPQINGGDRCRGKKRGRDGGGEVRCSFKAGENGYCKYHKQQGEKVQPRCLPSLQLHNHGSEKMFVRGCPGCEQKGLIGLSRLFSNE